MRVGTTLVYSARAPAARSRDLADLADRLARCRLCNRAARASGDERERVFSRPIATSRDGHRALIVGQAPGIHEPELGLPFGADAGRRLRRWFAPLGLEDEERFRATFAMTAVTKCYPGRVPGGAATGARRRASCALRAVDGAALRCSTRRS